MGRGIQDELIGTQVGHQNWLENKNRGEKEREKEGTVLGKREAETTKRGRLGATLLETMAGAYGRRRKKGRRRRKKMFLEGPCVRRPLTSF